MKGKRIYIVATTVLTVSINQCEANDKIQHLNESGTARSS